MNINMDNLVQRLLKARISGLSNEDKQHLPFRPHEQRCG